MTPVSTQPLSNSMNVYNVTQWGDEKRSSQCQVHLDSNQRCPCDDTRHHTCHTTRLRKILLPFALLVLALGAMLVISCATDVDIFEVLSIGAGANGSPLGKRATTGQSSFTQNKLYLIIIFVGLLLVLIAGIMLSFWCCKGAFENPLCCPCYLCACCGGLACLECVGCGLCAAGLEMA